MDSCWGRGTSFFSYIVWPLAGCPCSSGHPHAVALTEKEEDMKLGVRCWGSRRSWRRCGDDRMDQNTLYASVKFSKNKLKTQQMVFSLCLLKNMHLFPVLS